MKNASNYQQKIKWTVGIVTAPREFGYYLDQTIDSLQKAGWNELNVFAEPDSKIPDCFSGNVTYRKKQYGDWTNWAVALYELLLSEPDTDYFLMTEDDVVVNRFSKIYLEWSLPQLPYLGSASIYTPNKYNKKSRGFHNCCVGWDTWSTVTVIMPRESVINFFSDDKVQRHRFEDIFSQEKVAWGVDCDTKNSIKDAVIGQWAYKNRLCMYYHTPALAEHIGVHSTLSQGKATKENDRKSCDFIGEEVDVSKWMEDKLTYCTNLIDIPLG